MAQNKGVPKQKVFKPFSHELWIGIILSAMSISVLRLLVKHEVPAQRQRRAGRYTYFGSAGGASDACV